MRPGCESETDQEGVSHNTDQEAFIRDNIITGEEEEFRKYQDNVKFPRGESKQEDVVLVRRYLRSTKNKGAAVPDGISGRLVNMIQNTVVGRACIEDIAGWSNKASGVRVPSQAREMQVVMIPKPGKDASKVKR